MTLVIRADATREMGTGHVMRTLAIAQQWLRLGYGEVILIGAIQSKMLEEIVKGEGLRVVAAQGDQALSIMSEYTGNDRIWCVADGYHFSEAYLRSILERGFRLMLVDDLGNRTSYPATALLNANFYAAEVKYPESSVHYLIGPAYALLREEFRARNGIEKKQPNVAQRLLITIGGSDPAGLTPKVVEAVSLVQGLSFDVKVLLGPSAPPDLIPPSVIRDSYHRFSFLRGTNRISDLMEWADMAITAGGATCQELAYMQVPFLVVAVADNQEPGVSWLLSRGLAASLGGRSDAEVTEMADSIQKLAIDVEKRRFQAESLSRLVDGQGAVRVVRFMGALGGGIRKARREDRTLLFKWANDPAVRSASFSQRQISWDEHCRWFEHLMEKDDSVIYIALDVAGKPWGQIRFEEKEGAAVVSCSISEDFRGLGLGASLISRGTRRFLKETTGDVRPVAFIKAENSRSIRAFTRAGYRETGREQSRQGDGVVVMDYEV